MPHPAWIGELRRRGDENSLRLLEAYKKRGESMSAVVDGVETFETGATRSAETPFDPEGFINPAALRTYCRYMARHRMQADGELRDSDNWQKGMPTSRAWRSLFRHFFDGWLLKRGYPAESADCKSVEDALCGVIFNALLILTNIENDNHHEEG